ncbi:MAG TPA: hypothetical protein VN903_15500 [Polyangia bacterium]|jgi:hypothetical protein|nr:hypothetical protein [Polyangia bacterium]
MDDSTATMAILPSILSLSYTSSTVSWLDPNVRAEWTWTISARFAAVRLSTEPDRPFVPRALPN